LIAAPVVVPLPLLVRHVHHVPSVRAFSAPRVPVVVPLPQVEVRIEDVLRNLKAIAHTDLHVLSEESVVPGRWADKIKALELLMNQLDCAEAAYTVIGTLEQEVAAAEAQ